ncbi:MAG: hypothetical protein ACRDND_21745, partial [Streptosporangiaceae bacterium]
DRAAPWRAFGDLKAGDAMRPFREPLAVSPGADVGAAARPELGRLAGPVIYQGDPQAVFASESLAQTLRQIEVYGRDGLPVLSRDGQQVQGWITGASVLHAVAREIGGPPPQATPVPARGEAAQTRESSSQEPPNPLPGYHILEICIEGGSPAAGRALGTITWPPGSFPVSVLRDRNLQDPDPGIILCPGDRLNLLTRAPRPSTSRRPPGRPEPRPRPLTQSDLCKKI